MVFNKQNSWMSPMKPVFTFPKILAAIKEHTGVDLQPKKTKREEIEDLKAQVTHLSEWVKTTST